MLSKQEQKRRLNLVGNWDKGKESKAVYRSKIGMTEGIFNYWLKKYRELDCEKGVEKGETKEHFIELRRPVQQPLYSQLCEVRFPNGLELKLDFSDLGELIKVLKDA